MSAALQVDQRCSRLDITAIAHTADAGPAVRMRQDPQSVTPIETLDGQHWAKRGAPTALTLEQEPANKCETKHKVNECRQSRSAVIEQDRAQHYNTEQEASTHIGSGLL
jgi:hypothetical protein